MPEKGADYDEAKPRRVKEDVRDNSRDREYGGIRKPRRKYDDEIDPRDIEPIEKPSRPSRRLDDGLADDRPRRSIPKGDEGRRQRAPSAPYSSEDNEPQRQRGGSERRYRKDDDRFDSGRARKRDSYDDVTVSQRRHSVRDDRDRNRSRDRDRGKREYDDYDGEARRHRRTDDYDQRPRRHRDDDDRGYKSDRDGRSKRDRYDDYDESRRRRDDSRRRRKDDGYQSDYGPRRSDRDRDRNRDRRDRGSSKKQFDINDIGKYVDQGQKYYQKAKPIIDQLQKYLANGSAVFQHMDAKNHFAYKCQFCTETWPSDEACETHEREQHLYCRTHDRSFKNANNLRMHMNSNAHRPATLLCPLCKNSSYATATGLAHHLERGACPRAPNLNRDELFKIVRRCDPNSIISKNLLEWHGSPTYEATSRSWNARLQAYQCYLCNRLFKDLNALTQHINSPRTPSPDRSRKRVAFDIPASLQQFSALSRSLAAQNENAVQDERESEQEENEQDKASQRGNSTIVARAHVLGQSPTNGPTSTYDPRQFPDQQKWPQPSLNPGAVGHARFLERQWQSAQAAQVAENMRQAQHPARSDNSLPHADVPLTPASGNMADPTTAGASSDDGQSQPESTPRRGSRRQRFEVDIEQRRQAIIARLMETNPASIATPSSNIQIPASSTQVQAGSPSSSSSIAGDKESQAPSGSQSELIAALIAKKRAENAANGSLNRWLSARQKHKQAQEAARSTPESQSASLSQREPD
ncbi:hypothetical protein DV738_g3532, partial [Chaetothyriales sp. CBS 135597]